jgi:hypothetical protein
MIGGPAGVRDEAGEAGDPAPEDAGQKSRRRRHGDGGTARGTEAVEGEGDRLDADQQLDPARIDVAEGQPAQGDADHGAGQDDAQVGGVGLAAEHHQADQVDRQQDRQHHGGGEGRRHGEGHQRHAEAAGGAAETGLGHAEQQGGDDGQQPEGEGEGGGVVEHAWIIAQSALTIQSAVTAVQSGRSVEKSALAVRRLAGDRGGALLRALSGSRQNEKADD